MSPEMLKMVMEFFNAIENKSPMPWTAFAPLITKMQDSRNSSDFLNNLM